MLNNDALLDAILNAINGSYVLILDYDGYYINAWSDTRLDQLYALDFKSLIGKNIFEFTSPDVAQHRLVMVQGKFKKKPI